MNHLSLLALYQSVSLFKIFADMLWKIAVYSVAGFLIGGIPFGFIVGKLKGVDLRKTGSGNIGATNVLRTLGAGWGIFILILDALKGAVPVIIAKQMNFSPVEVAVLGFSLILGHVFCPYLGFKGGKGVATSLGVFLSIIPVQVLVSAVVFFAVVLTTRYVSLGSITAAVVLPVITAFTVDVVEYKVFSAVVGLIVIFRHRANIVRLLKGTENRIGSGGKKVER